MTTTSETRFSVTLLDYALVDSAENDELLIDKDGEGLGTIYYKTKTGEVIDVIKTFLETNKIGGGGTIIPSETQPEDMEVGQLWFQIVDDTLKIHQMREDGLTAINPSVLISSVVDSQGRSLEEILADLTSRKVFTFSAEPPADPAKGGIWFKKLS